MGTSLQEFLGALLGSGTSGPRASHQKPQWAVGVVTKEWPWSRGHTGLERGCDFPSGSCLQLSPRPPQELPAGRRDFHSEGGLVSTSVHTVAFKSWPCYSPSPLPARCGHHFSPFTSFPAGLHKLHLSHTSGDAGTSKPSANGHQKAL